MPRGELRGCVWYPTRTFRVSNPSVPYLRDSPCKQYPTARPTQSTKPVIRTQRDVQDWANEYRHPLHKLLEYGVWPVSIEDGQDLGVPQADVNDPKSECVKRDFEGRPAFPKPDFRKTRLTLLNVEFEGGKDLFVVVRFPLEDRK